MRRSRLLAALALPFAMTAAALAADPYYPVPVTPGSPTAPVMAPYDASALMPASLNRRNTSPASCLPQPPCSPYPGATGPGMMPWVPSQQVPGQTPGQVPGQVPGQPPVTSPVQTPEAAAAAPQTGAFSQAPSAIGEAAFSFTPNMIGDLGVGGSFARGFITLPGTPGTAPSTGTNGNGGTGGQVVDLRIVPIPATGRGAFKIQENESPRPIDRVFFNYNYFTDIGRGIANFPTFDLHRQVIGLEKTFWGGDASVEVRINAIQSTGDGSLRGQDFGDTTFVSKFALFNEPGGNVLTVGMAVTAPTGPDLILLDGSRLHPTLLQPFSGFIWVADRLYAQGFSSIIVPTDSRDVLLSTGSLALGYQVFRAACPGDSIISYIAPTIEGHATIPINHRGINHTPTGFPDFFVLTNGVNVGIGSCANLLVGVAVPLTGPKLYSMEAMALLNFRF